MYYTNRYSILINNDQRYLEIAYIKKFNDKRKRLLKIKTEKMISLIITLIITVSIASFLVGKYTERLEWNKLIKLGKIQRPNNASLNHYKYWANDAPSTTQTGNSDRLDK